MPVAADLQAFASLNMPDDDVGTSGGAIDLSTRVDFTPIAANDDIEVVSDNVGDISQDCTIEVRKLDGSVDTELVTLNGTTPVVFATLGVIERILKCTLSAAATGIVTLQRSPSGATIRDIPAGETGFVRMFRKSASESGATLRYEKLFWKNTHSTEALLTALVKQNADPSTKITHAVSLAVDDSVSVADRKTPPPPALPSMTPISLFPGQTWAPVLLLVCGWNCLLMLTIRPSRIPTQVSCLVRRSNVRRRK